MVATATPDDIAYLTALVRAHDRPRYYATLFAPAPLRGDLFALYGFAAEIARVPDQVGEPGLGEIRLRWWQDSLAEAVSSGGADTPTLRAIVAIIERHRLPLAAFEALIEARSFDLYSDPPSTIVEVEGRMGEIESVLFQMAAIILGSQGQETAEAAGHAGIAYGVARRLAMFPSERARGRMIVPTDVLARQGLTSNHLFAANPTSSLRPAIAEMLAFAGGHLDLAKAAVSKLTPTVRLGFLPIAIVQPLLRRVERRGPGTATRDAEISDLETLLRIGVNRLRILGRQGKAEN